MKKLLLLGSHLFALAAGFGLGVYVLPILTAPDPPSATDVHKSAAAAAFTGKFHRDLKDSDALHWGEGIVSIGPRTISLLGRIAPGPDYKLYLSPEFVETEADFARLKSTMVRLGDVKTFENFIVEVPSGVDPARYNTVIVWCESFSQFITSAKYR
jgi:hypothetical protein